MGKRWRWRWREREGGIQSGREDDGDEGGGGERLGTANGCACVRRNGRASARLYIIAPPKKYWRSGRGGPSPSPRPNPPTQLIRFSLSFSLSLSSNNNFPILKRIFPLCKPNRNYQIPPLFHSGVFHLLYFHLLIIPQLLLCIHLYYAHNNKLKKFRTQEVTKRPPPRSRVLIHRRRQLLIRRFDSRPRPK